MEDEDEFSLFDEPIMQDGPDLFGEVDDDGAQGAHLPADEPTDDEAGALAPPPSKLGSAPRSDMPEPQLALYRRYRPDTFSDVIGQDHVTVPLQRALANNRVNHAYLFSGPRGCGKTTSARILARCLNCEQGPTPNPCGECQSCVDLARGGPGSIDVIEIDAASHGGVDDARDLRERAFFAPVASRYKIYIVDEAHMVTAAGFNALLKLVEEPPPHAKFIFATTEPEKVIGTIRSRTHHYPFRLVPPRTLSTFLAEICEAEGVQIEQRVLPLVVRAGAGSVRDSLSVLDQLLGGSGEHGVEYEQASALLGYTPDALLDDIVDAFASGDGETVFTTIDKVIESGQDPRRFGEDLLRRLRDLVILANVPTAIEDNILDVPDDQGERLKSQAHLLGPAELSRAAAVIAVGLTEMRGTTAPRLHLELMCARVLLPGADVEELGLSARMDRLERRLGMMQLDDSAPATAPAAPPAAAPAPTRPAPTPAQAPPSQPAPAQPAQDQTRPEPEADPTAPRPMRRPAGSPPRQRPAGAPPAGSDSPAPPPSQPTPAPQPAAPRPASSAPGKLNTAEMRRAWPTVLEEVKNRRRFTYMLLSQHAHVQEVNERMLVLGFANPGARDNFSSGGSHDVLVDSIIQVLGVELHVQGVVANEELAERGQRLAGSAPAEPQQESPQQYYEPAPPPEPEYAETSDDDEDFDGSSNAAELLGRELGAEIISVDEDPQDPA